jgi:glucose-6-phosphate 1-epimerase
MEDITEDGFHEFVCIEAVNAYDNTIKLVSGEEHTTSTIISLDRKASSLGLGQNGGGFTVV